MLHFSYYNFRIRQILGPNYLDPVNSKKKHIWPPPSSNNTFLLTFSPCPGGAATLPIFISSHARLGQISQGSD